MPCDDDVDEEGASDQELVKLDDDERKFQMKKKN